MAYLILNEKLNIEKVPNFVKLVYKFNKVIARYFESLDKLKFFWKVNMEEEHRRAWEQRSPGSDVSEYIENTEQYVRNKDAKQ